MTLNPEACTLKSKYSAQQGATLGDARIEYTIYRADAATMLAQQSTSGEQTTFKPYKSPFREADQLYRYKTTPFACFLCAADCALYLRAVLNPTTGRKMVLLRSKKCRKDRLSHSSKAPTTRGTWGWGCFTGVLWYRLRSVAHRW